MHKYYNVSLTAIKSINYKSLLKNLPRVEIHETENRI